MVRKKSLNVNRKGIESYTSPDRTITEGSQLAYMDYSQPTCKEPSFSLNVNKDEFVDQAVPSTTIHLRPNSPVDFTHRATDDSNYQKLQSIVHYIKRYEIFTEYLKKAIIRMSENGITDINAPDIKILYLDVEYYTQRHLQAVGELSSLPL
ncbi:hypothetical protein TNCV_594071 [Trichonephila clavipes]|nr:hypothetical protein TNCV_594071 [Trichonephila clavipes]